MSHFLKISWSGRKQEKEEKENKVLWASKMATQEDSELDSSEDTPNPQPLTEQSPPKRTCTPAEQLVCVSTEAKAHCEASRMDWGCLAINLTIGPATHRQEGPQTQRFSPRSEGFVPHTKLPALNTCLWEASPPSICLENQWGLLPQTQRAANWETAVERFARRLTHPRSQPRSSSLQSTEAIRV